jgi:hypothetical protein
VRGTRQRAALGETAQAANKPRRHEMKSCSQRETC